jgi:hypothetical protein
MTLMNELWYELNVLIVTCEGVECGSGKKCVVKQERGPVCICSPTCSRRKRRMGSVCGKFFKLKYLSNRSKFLAYILYYSKE